MVFLFGVILNLHQSQSKANVNLLITTLKRAYMFKTKTKKQIPSTSNLPDTPSMEQNCNHIAPGTHIEGKFTTLEDLRMDGRLTGEIICQKKFVMGENGHVNGEVECQDSTIKGKILGSIRVKGLLHLLSTAKIEGKIFTKKMVVDEGAAYSGECHVS